VRTKPPYEPSDNDRCMVRNMAAAGIAANCIHRCLPNRPKSEKTFRKAFREELDTSADIVSAKAISNLVVAIDAGQAWAICFWLKCRAGFQETSAHRFVAKDGEDRKMDMEAVRAFMQSDDRSG